MRVLPAPLGRESMAPGGSQLSETLEVSRTSERLALEWRSLLFAT